MPALVLLIVIASLEARAESDCAVPGSGGEFGGPEWYTLRGRYGLAVQPYLRRTDSLRSELSPPEGSEVREWYRAPTFGGRVVEHYKGPLYYVGFFYVALCFQSGDQYGNFTTFERRAKRTSATLDFSDNYFGLDLESALMTGRVNQTTIFAWSLQLGLSLLHGLPASFKPDRIRSEASMNVIHHLGLHFDLTDKRLGYATVRLGIPTPYVAGWGLIAPDYLLYFMGYPRWSASWEIPVGPVSLAIEGSVPTTWGVIPSYFEGASAVAEAGFAF